MEHVENPKNRIERRAGSGVDDRMPSGGVRLDGGGPVISEGEASLLESDVSSVLNISDHFAPSDTEDDDGLNDKKKYVLPDVGKTRLHRRTKEPLSPDPRATAAPTTTITRTPVLYPPRTPTPGTPQASRASEYFQSPIWPAFPTRNGSSESLGDGGLASRIISRTNSLYTLGRASLQGQLSHLTSLKLPDPDSLAKRISSIPTSAEAARALSDAAEQIQIWIGKASEVLGGLDAENDVEWAAAGGKEGVEDVDQAISRFQELIEVYVLSIERLQTREDIAALPAVELQSTVKQMENILASWQKVKATLRGVKEQVEVAMEWELLWNSVLGEIRQEMDALNRLVFEMEERRHQGAGSLLSSKDSIDLHELETIVEERPGQGAPLHSHRLSLPGAFSPITPVDGPPPSDTKEDTSLLALFAQMQPLRASLDFLPMRLSAFKLRGSVIFPSACTDLDTRREQLEDSWKKLEADAESLRRELGEDRWVLVFRNAGRQALKMEESITRSYNKLRDAVDAGEYTSNAPSFARKVESYDAKKSHYGPAVERVLAIIDRGVKERLTVNGEILRLQGDMKHRWSALQGDMRDMDLVLEELPVETPDTQYRDSVSTVVSSERSLASSLVDTPGSSPASSVVGGLSGNGSRTPTPLMLAKPRTSSARIPSSIPRRIPLTYSGNSTPRSLSSPLARRTASQIPSPPTATRPRWQIATKPESRNRDFLPLSALEPSPYAKTPVAKQSNFLRSSSNPSDSPSTRALMSRKASTPNLGHHSVRPPSTTGTPPPSHSASSRKSGLPMPQQSTTPMAAGQRSLASRKSYAGLRSTAQVSSAAARRTSIVPPLPPRFTDGNDADTESPLHHKARPPSVNDRRSSMLPMRAKAAALNEVLGNAQGERAKWRP